MNIFVDNSGYALNNLGDVAMLQVAVARLRALWPAATIKVLTSAPDALSRYCPGTVPVPSMGMRRWFEWTYVPARWHMPAVVARRAARSESWLRQRLPSLMDSLALQRGKGRPSEAAEVRDFLDAADGADLLVLTGGGYVTDAFPSHTAIAMDLLRRFQRNGVPTVMMGQGIGPLSDETLVWRARAALPFVDRIALRESKAGLPLLARLGVPAGRVRITGDDAIEPAFATRATSGGDALGFNVRVSSYSSVNPETLDRLRAGLDRAAATVGADPLAIPISLAPAESDVHSLRSFFAATPEATRGLEDVAAPEDVVRRIGRCRVVVTGSYHAGVFALAQGIPVVGLSRSRYYADKFQGLADAFGVGCRVLFLDAGDPAAELPMHVASLWKEADDLRPRLLEAAARQVAAGREAYRELHTFGHGTAAELRQGSAAAAANP
jgi:polysaccharide pyruvyl transferase WcaK-like protein